MSREGGEQVEAALAFRLAQIVPHLAVDLADDAAHDPVSAQRVDGAAAALLDLVARNLCVQPTPDRLWLALTAVAGCLPRADDILEAGYRAETSNPAQTAIWMLDYALERGSAETRTRSLRVLPGAVFVDPGVPGAERTPRPVDALAASILARWTTRNHVICVSWTPGDECWTAAVDGPTEFVVPWHSTVVLLGRPPLGASERIAAAAQYSGSLFAALTDDCFPAASAGLRDDSAVSAIARYLGVLRHFSRLAALSEASAADFRGLASALPAQGLVGPNVAFCAPPTTPPPLSPRTSRAPAVVERPPVPPPQTVICVGDLDDRPSQSELRYACERLRSEGLRFELRVEGPEAQKLDSLYASARFAVFPSPHEGNALAISQCLATGVPVVCSKFLATSPADGIAFFDASDPASLRDVMRALLVDDDRISNLRAQIDGRRNISYDDYADNLWGFLVDGPDSSEGSGLPGGAL